MTRQRLGAWGVALEDAGLDTALVLEVINRTLDEDLSWAPMSRPAPSSTPASAAGRGWSPGRPAVWPGSR